MTLRRCDCGGAAAIRSEYDGRVYKVRVVCQDCGRRGRHVYDKREPVEGSASVYWAAMSWNCKMYEEEARQ